MVITTYRRPRLALEAVRSCLEQGPLLHKIVVVDDASRDETEEVLKALGDPRIEVIVRSENGGIGAARRDSFLASTADWTVQLDSDQILLPGALDALGALAARVPREVGILGGRYGWDHGGVSPAMLPSGSIDYRKRIEWCERPNSIGTDYVCCVSRRVRESVRWTPLRAGLVDVLFQLDAAKEAHALFTGRTLALQRSDAPEGYTRGPALSRLARRKRDAQDGLELLRLILERHGGALAEWGPRQLGGYLVSGSAFALLEGRRGESLRLASKALALPGARRHALAIALLSLGGRGAYEWAYRLRG